MKVLFGNHFYGYLKYGGGEVQLEQTREALVRAGVDVRLFNPWDRECLRGVDVVHWFHIDPAAKEILEAAKSRGVRIVLSSIFWPHRNHLGIWTRLSGLPKRLGIPVISYHAAAREVAQLGDIVIASSEMEMKQVCSIFGIPPDRVRIIPLGVSAEFEHGKADEFVGKYGLKDFILCVGRIERRKNQVRLLKALSTLEIPLVFIGDTHVEPDYYRLCLEVRHPSAHFLGAFDHTDGMLRAAYKAARVLAMPSLFETPGLVALEAAIAGCRLAVTQNGNTREYFGDLAEYMNPLSESSIRNAIERAFAIPDNKVESLKQKIRMKYTWDTIAKGVLSIYQELLSVGR